MRRSSKSIVLVLIGGAVAGCGPVSDAPSSSNLVQDRYATLEDCAADWGRPLMCERESDTGSGTSTGGSTGGGWRGPYYSAWQRDDAQRAYRDQARQSGVYSDAPPGNRSVGRVAAPSVARGGFGSSSRSFSSGG